jgi:prephenate dehydrogenase
VAEPAPDAAPPAWLGEAVVAIVGLGLMGGSLGQALRGVDGGARRCRRVLGVMRRPSPAALRAGAADEITADLNAVAAADVVVLATPMRALLALLPEVAARMKPGALLTDCGSVKGPVVDVMSSLPAGLLLAGGHPMCGKESGGLAAASPTLFHGAAYAVCPVAGQGPEAGACVAALARAVGARPLQLDAAAHDRIVAAVSHGAYLSAVVLTLAAEDAAQSEGDGLWDLAASGFRDSTRVAAGEIDMWVDILLTNREAALAQIGRAGAALAMLEEAISTADESRLRALLARAQRRRRGLFRASTAPARPDSDA